MGDVRTTTNHLLVTDHVGNGKFGCNGKDPQAAVTAPAAATDLATAVTLVNNLRATLLANGISK